ncbi:hypothetical protein [Mycobacterium intracellulare]|uniref:hypothetical protein n=1 Tax=Mycobacterium intracellulare TaxID=1767 RepID=UPI00109EAD7B|nr:hypothetical protein [Mycobacterium intracellulare]
MMSKTEQALRTFDRFITDWTPPAMHDDLFGHKANAADSVRRAILGIVDQRALALRPGPFGYAVFRKGWPTCCRGHTMHLITAKQATERDD